MMSIQRTGLCESHLITCDIRSLVPQIDSSVTLRSLNQKVIVKLITDHQGGGGK